MALEKSIKILAATPPPNFAPGSVSKRTVKGKWAYLSANKGNARIAELEKTLGIEHTAPILNLARMNIRIAELEDMLAEKSTPAQAAAAAIPPEPKREFQSTGDATMDSAIKAAGCFSLEEFKAKSNRDRHFAAAANLPPGSLARQCAEENLRRAQAQMKG